MPTMRITIDTPDGEATYRVPAFWEICERCDGDGTHCGGATFTASELDEIAGDDWDYRDNFVRSMRDGWYNCEDCRGTGKTLHPDEEAATGAALDAIREWTDTQRLYAQMDADDRAVRRAESGYAW